MSFFNSEFVRSELSEIADLQETIYRNVFDFYRMDKEQQIEHVNNLQKLLEKQRILYTRMSLSDDPDAQEMKERINDSAKMMGLHEGVDINLIFSNMEKLLEKMKSEISNNHD